MFFKRTKFKSILFAWQETYSYVNTGKWTYQLFIIEKCLNMQSRYVRVSFAKTCEKTIHQYRKTDNWCCPTQKKNEDKVDISYVFFFFFFSLSLDYFSSVLLFVVAVLTLSLYLLNITFPTDSVYEATNKKNIETRPTSSLRCSFLFFYRPDQKKKLGTVSVILFSFYS